MYRYLVGAIVVAAIAAVIGWKWYQQNQTERQREQAQINELSGRVGQLQDQNNQLNAALAKVQAEEQRQVTENDLLAKTLEQAKLTGKIPDKLPYPPK
jgi:membrane protein implicated in regulation of membrane protease activity